MKRKEWITKIQNKKTTEKILKKLLVKENEINLLFNKNKHLLINVFV